LDVVLNVRLHLVKICCRQCSSCLDSRLDTTVKPSQENPERLLTASSRSIRSLAQLVFPLPLQQFQFQTKCSTRVFTLTHFYTIADSSSSIEGYIRSWFERLRSILFQVYASVKLVPNEEIIERKGIYAYNSCFKNIFNVLLPTTHLASLSNLKA
jgi:hypothetical protein